MIYIFGEYELDIVYHELRRAGVPQPIEPKAFDLLAYFLQSPGRVLSKEDLFAHVWPEQFVSESALTYCIAVARKAVGDSGRAQRLIKTVHGRGYRFVAAVETRSREHADAGFPSSPPLSDDAVELSVEELDVEFAVDPVAAELPFTPQPEAEALDQPAASRQE